jgi:phosphoribosylformylglycinamidine synthase
MWQFRSAIEGMAKACGALGVPVVSGNVSFYNETTGKGIHPTPAVAMVGLLVDASKRRVQWFSGDGDRILLAGADRLGVHLGGSLYLKEVHGTVAGTPPPVDLAHEKRLQEFLREAASADLVASAHDLAEGGFACALAESCISGPGNPMGARVFSPFPADTRPDFAMFSECQGAVLLSCAPAKRDALLDLARRFRITMMEVGVVGGEHVDIEGLARVETAELRKAWSEGFAAILGLEG